MIAPQNYLFMLSHQGRYQSSPKHKIGIFQILIKDEYYTGRYNISLSFAVSIDIKGILEVSVTFPKRDSVAEVVSQRFDIAHLINGLTTN